MIFNPTNKDIEEEIELNTYYTGISGKVEVVVNESESYNLMPDRNYKVKVPILIKANSFGFIMIKKN